MSPQTVQEWQHNFQRHEPTAEATIVSYRTAASNYSSSPSSSLPEMRSRPSLGPPLPATKVTETVDEKETFSSASARLEAYNILDNWERLAWYANARDESIPQTRLYFTKILHGINPDTPEPLLTDAKYGDVQPLRSPESGGNLTTAATGLGHGITSRGFNDGEGGEDLGAGKSSRLEGQKPSTECAAAREGEGSGVGSGTSATGGGSGSTGRGKRKSESRK